MARVMPHPQHSTPKRFLEIQIVLPLQIFSNGIAYSTAGSSTVISSLVNFDRLSVCIGEVACQNHNEINQAPNTTTATGQQLSNTSTCLTYIEAMDAQTSKEKAQEENSQPLI